MRFAVAEELARQGRAAGERAIWRGLVARGAVLSRYRVRVELRALKAEQRRAERERLAEHRTQVTPLYRDVLWALDATHLGRDTEGRAVEAEVLREVASTRTLELSIGPKATAEDVVLLLERAVEARGGAPLVLVTDNGSAYVAAKVERWCAEHGVLHLLNEPRTPEHNACAEHGIGELKRDADIASAPCTTPIEALLRLVASLERLDHARLRATRGWQTAAEADQALPHWSLQADRGRFYATACCAIQHAVLDSPSGRAGRRAKRQAILHVLTDFKLIQWTRGKAPASTR